MSTGTRVEASIKARSTCSVSPAATETEGSFSGISVASMLCWQDQHLHLRETKNVHGVFPGTGDDEPPGDGFGAGEAEIGGCAPGAAEAAGVAGAPGCVPSGAGGGLTAAAGWPRLSELGPATEVAFGVPLASGDGDGAADACASGVAIGPAAAGFFLANSATVNSIARLIGKRTVPLFLSIQPYVVSVFV